MLDRQQILGLIPHQGTMCLLDRVLEWSPAGIACVAWSHLSPDNPLRSGGRLNAVCGVEYGLQAAALHGALSDGGRAPGYLAALRDVALGAPWLDHPAPGALHVTAAPEWRSPAGLIYRFAVTSEGGMPLLDGRATIVLRHP